jgi:DNA replication protein DnaC
MACALAHQASRKGYRALYRSASRFFRELTLAPADGRYILLAKPARADVLLIDDFDLAPPLQDQERRDLLAEQTLANSSVICDRLLHDTQRIVLQRREDRRSSLRS